MEPILHRLHHWSKLLHPHAIKEEANADTIQLAFIMVFSYWGRGGKTRLFIFLNALICPVSVLMFALCLNPHLIWGRASLDMHSLGGLGCFAEAPRWVKLREQKVLFWAEPAMKDTRYQDQTHFQRLNCKPLDFVVNSFNYTITWALETEIEMPFLKVPTL